MSILPLQINQRVLTASDLQQIFSGTQNIDAIKVTFDTEWNGFAKTAVFSRNGTDCFFSDLDSSGVTMIPATVLEESGTVFIGIMGEKGNQRITSSLIRYRVGEGASVTDLLDPDAIHSMMDLLNEALADSGGITGKRTGTTFTPSLSTSGVLSWTNDGGLENPTPVNIKGPQGVGIQSVSVYLARSTSGSSAPSSGYSTSVPTLTTTYRYLWGYLRFTLSNGQTTETGKMVMGVYGNTGAQGAAGFSPTLAASKTNGTTTITVTDANGTRELAQILDGTDGEDGNDVTSKITSIDQYYCRYTSGAYKPSSSATWSTTVPTLDTSNPYMWSYFKVNYQDGTSVDSQPFLIGNYNERLSTLNAYYLLTTTDTPPSISTSGWSTSMPTPTSGSPYLWCHFRFLYFAYHSSSSHNINSDVFLLRTYQTSSGGSSATGLVLNYVNAQSANDTSQGDAALRSIQMGIMPVIYTNNEYFQVIHVEPITVCGANFLRMYYLSRSCSSTAILTTIEWRISS